MEEAGAGCSTRGCVGTGGGFEGSGRGCGGSGESLGDARALSTTQAAGGF